MMCIWNKPWKNCEKHCTIMGSLFSSVSMQKKNSVSVVLDLCVGVLWEFAFLEVRIWLN